MKIIKERDKLAFQVESLNETINQLNGEIETKITESNQAMVDIFDLLGLMDFENL